MSDSHSVRQLFDLTDRVAIITGGAGMLGVRYADAIAEMGGVPVLADKDGANAEKAAKEISARWGGKALGIEVDITREDAVLAMVSDVMDQLGRIDILINNAAMTVKGGGGGFDNYFAPYEDYPRDLFDMALQINLTGAFLVTQAVGKVMVEQRRGVIVNVSSDVGTISPNHKLYVGMEYAGKPFNTPIAYSMSKAALLAFTRYLATYWAEKGIRVNAISPAGVFDDHDADFVERFSTLLPMARMAHKDEYKGAMLFLCSDASSFMTGANLAIDGGRTAW